MRPNQRSLFIFFKYRCYRVCMIKKLIWIIAFYRTSHTNFYPDSAPFQTAIKDRTTEHQITRSFCMTSIKERKIDQTSTSYHLLHKPVLALSTFFNPMPRKTVIRKTGTTSSNVSFRTHSLSSTTGTIQKKLEGTASRTNVRENKGK